MFCEECGTQLEDDALFCPECGNQIRNETATPQNIEQKPGDLAKKGTPDLKKWIGVSALGVLVILIGLSAFGISKGWHIRHKWSEATCTEPETCIKGGETRGEALGHDWTEATCTEPKTCTVCGEVRGKATGHVWLEATCTEPETCTVCGEVRGEATGHIWIEATCTEPEICAVCGETGEEAPGHTWQILGCEVPQVCAVCGVQGETPGHDWNAEYACLKARTCNRCQKVEAAQKHMLDGVGKCINCGEQIGIVLSGYNFQNYFELKIHTESRIYDKTKSDGPYYYLIRLYTVKGKETYRFSDMKIFTKLYLTSDISLGIDGAVQGTIRDIEVFVNEDKSNPKQLKVSTNLSVVPLEEDYTYFFPEEDDVNKKYINSRSDLIGHGLLYSIEGFCYDDKTAELAK